MAYPTTQTLSSEEKDLVWQYRFYLSANKKSLAKFVKCVNWKSATEANQALELVSLNFNVINRENEVVKLGFFAMAVIKINYLVLEAVIEFSLCTALRSYIFYLYLCFEWYTYIAS